MAWEAALAEAAGRVAHAQRVVCLTGAGVSADSGLATFRGVMKTEWNLLMAASTAMILPVILLFFFAQRYFVDGLVLSGLKG